MCICLTSQGKQCSLSPVSGSLYCHVHKSGCKYGKASAQKKTTIKDCKDFKSLMEIEPTQEQKYGLQLLSKVYTTNMRMYHSMAETLNFMLQQLYHEMTLYYLIVKQSNVKIKAYLVFDVSKVSKQPSTTQVGSKYKCQVGHHFCTLQKQIIINSNDQVSSDYDLIFVGADTKHSQHASLLLIDHKQKTIEYFDPLGITQTSEACDKCLNAWVQRDPYIGYQFIHIHQTCPISLQNDANMCFLWSLTFIYMRMKCAKNWKEWAEWTLTDKQHVQDLPFHIGLYFWNEAEKLQLNNMYAIWNLYKEYTDKDAVEDYEKVRLLFYQGDREKFIKYLKPIFEEYIKDGLLIKDWRMTALGIF